MCEFTSWQGVALAAFAILEFWLGKTDALEAGSSLEMAFNIVKKSLKFLFPAPKA